MRLIKMSGLAPEHRWHISTCVVFLAICLSGSALHAEVWNEAYENGKSALDHGDWNKAVASFQAAVADRSHPDRQAMTAGLKLVEYLPYYYLGQAYLYSGDSRLALENFRKEEQAGEVAKTTHQHHLERLKKIAEQLVLPAEPRPAAPDSRDSTLSTLSATLDLIDAEDFIQAQAKIDELKTRRPGDRRWNSLEQYIRLMRQEPDIPRPLLPPPVAPMGRERFEAGLNHYLLGEYQLALKEFTAALQQDPNLGVAAAWVRKTQADLAGLKQKTDEKIVEPPDPAMPQSIAPLFAISTPAGSVTQVRSGNARLAGQVGDDQGIDHIEFTLNGAPLLDASGVRVMIRPGPTDDPKRIAFATDIPLQKGENQIVVTAYDVDSPQHWTPEPFRIFRKPAVYETAVFRISLAAIALLGLGAVLLQKAIKYRIAIINKYNPYIAGSPIRNEKMLFGREQLLTRILNTLHNNSLMLYGPRRIGKTSLQHELKRRLETLKDPDYLYIPVMIDLQGTSEDRFFNTLIEDILEACRPRLKDVLSFELQRNKNDYSGREFSRDLKTLIDALKKTTEKQLKLVLLIDEVDELNKYSEQVNQRLRSVFMKSFADNLVAVMSGAYIRKNWESEGSPWYNFFQEMEIPPLQADDATNLICEPVKGIFSYDARAIDSILEYSERKPYLIQRFCINVINRIIEEKRRRVTVGDVEAVREVVLSVVEGGDTT